jgi:RNA polymerase sigma factor (sigma-70 family)
MFVVRYGRLVQAILRRMELSAEDRQDVYQQVFQHLWERNCLRLSQWKARGNGKFSSFLEVIVVRLVYDQKRCSPEWMHRVEQLTSGDEQSEFEGGRHAAAMTADPVWAVICRQQKAAIDSMLYCLSERDSQIIRRRHYHEQSYREIAEALNIRLDQVGVVVLRAERRLRKHVRGAYPGLCD